MGKIGNASIEAREQARARRIELERDRQQRDERVDDATAAVIVARAAIATARELAAASNAASRASFEASVIATDRATASAVAEQQDVIDAAVHQLIAERLTARDVASLTALALADVRRIVRGQVGAGSLGVKGVRGEPQRR